MDELKKNFQLCYFDLHNAKGVGLNLLMFGYRQFSETFLYKNRQTYKNLCEGIGSKSPNVIDISAFALNNLIDSIKIHICFENFLKTIYIIQGVIVHRLDGNVFPEMAKKQKMQPVLRDEVIKPELWIENPKIDLPIKSYRLQVSGILNTTLGTSILMKEGYLNPIGLNQKTASLFKPYLEYRNNLHYYTDESMTLTAASYSNLERMIKFVNLNIVTLQNKLVSELSMNDHYKLKPLPQ